MFQLSQADFRKAVHFKLKYVEVGSTAARILT